MVFDGCFWRACRGRVSNRPGANEMMHPDHFDAARVIVLFLSLIAIATMFGRFLRHIGG